MAEVLVSAATIRRAQPPDANLQRAFFAGLSHESRYHRFMSPMREVPAALLERLTRSDRFDHVALLAEVGGEMVGEARFARDGAHTAEFALAVTDTWQGRGLGRRLLAALESAAVDAGIRRLVGDTLRGNAGMTGLARRSGYAVLPAAGGLWTLRLAKDLEGRRIAA